MIISFRFMLTGAALLTSAFLVNSRAASRLTPGGLQFAGAIPVEAAARAVSSGTSLSARENDNSGPHLRETDERLERADAHLNSGKRFYFQGDLVAARREFDTAINTLLNSPESVPDHARIERRLEEMCDLIYRFDIEKLGAGKVRDEAAIFDKAPIDEISHMTFPVDEKLAPRLKSELNQTRSAIPLELADPVLSYVHYFQTERGRATLLAGLRRSGRYKALIQKVFAEEGVPQELIYLAQAESGFLPRAVSYKSAVGMWQFIAETGATYQLGRTAAYDERFDPEKATHAAAKYLKDLYARYDDWYLAMAAYNCGAGAVDRAIERTGYADYWELLKRHALPKETSSYVPIIVAMTIMAKNPGDYGLENIEADPAVEYDTIRATAPTNLNLIADATLQPLSIIRELNPALLNTVAPTGFAVHIPKGSTETAEAGLENVPAGNRQAWRLHHVLAGDTLDAIARTYHLTPDRIASVNQSADSIEAGDVLLIPAAYHPDSASPRPRSATGRRSVLSRSFRAKTAARRASHFSASRHISAPVLHRKAGVRTASLTR